MIVAKLSTDKVVQLLKPAQSVAFADGLWVLVCSRLTDRQNKGGVWWVPATTVVGKIDFC